MIKKSVVHIRVFLHSFHIHFTSESTNDKLREHFIDSIGYLIFLVHMRDGGADNSYSILVGKLTDNQPLSGLHRRGHNMDVP